VDIVQSWDIPFIHHTTPLIIGASMRVLASYHQLSLSYLSCFSNWSCIGFAADQY